MDHICFFYQMKHITDKKCISCLALHDVEGHKNLWYGDHYPNIFFYNEHKSDITMSHTTCVNININITN